MHRLGWGQGQARLFGPDLSSYFKTHKNKGLSSSTIVTNSVSPKLSGRWGSESDRYSQNRSVNQNNVFKTVLFVGRIGY